MQEPVPKPGGDAWPPRPSWGFALVTIGLMTAALAVVWCANYLEMLRLQ